MTGSQKHYSAVAIVLHWAIAALILYNIWLGWRYSGHYSAVGVLQHLPLIGDSLSHVPTKGLVQYQVLQLHKSVGFTILALSLVRLAWRLVNKPPAYAHEPKAWENTAAHIVHWGFYLIMIGLPLTGWIMVSASPTNIPTLLYKHLPFPHLGFIHAMAMPARKAIDATTTDLHYRLVNLTYLLLALHIGAALKHQFRDRDEVLWRMLPFPFLRPKGL